MLNRSPSGRGLRRLEHLLRDGIAGDLSDSDLIERFLSSGDSAREAAFTALVERHGPMVFRVCRQTLLDHHAAQDAVQATFLVLARHAGAIRKRTSVSSWLFGVARRAAARIRMDEARRQHHELRRAARLPALTSGDRELADADLYPELHAEIERLPQKYRVPIVLCYLDGLTHEQAASRLRWPLGTVKTRLTRGRERLRARLEKHGRPALLLQPASALRAGHAAELPEHVASAISEAACRYGATGALGWPVSTLVIKVTQGVLRSMLIHKLKLAGVVVSGLFLIGFGAVAAQRASRNADAGQTVAAIGSRTDSPSTLELHGTIDLVPDMVVRVHTRFDCRVDKVLVDLGQTVKKGDPLVEVFSTELAEAKRDYLEASSEWDRHRIATKDLARTGALATAVSEANNAASQSRLKAAHAKEKLGVYGLTAQEINAAEKEDAIQKARMILRAHSEGMVVERNVVPGNFYDSRDTLMTVARLDPLWVVGSVGEADAQRLKVGQSLTVTIPYGNHPLKSKVEYIDAQVDPETHRVKFRTSIPNPGLELKPGLFVRLAVETDAQPRKAGRSRVPREAPAEQPAHDRLSELERKVDQLLGEKEERLSHAKILERLEALERKLDRILDGRR